MSTWSSPRMQPRPPRAASVRPCTLRWRNIFGCFKAVIPNEMKTNMKCLLCCGPAAQILLRWCQQRRAPSYPVSRTLCHSRIRCRSVQHLLIKEEHLQAVAEAFDSLTGQVASLDWEQWRRQQIPQMLGLQKPSDTQENCTRWQPSGV